MSLVNELMTQGYTTADSVSTGMYSDTLNRMTDKLGTYIKEERMKRGWTQVELAERAGVPKQTVNRLETGTTKLPGALIRRQLAEALGVRHVDMLIAAGEITADEVAGLPAPDSPAIAALRPVLDTYEGDIKQLVRVIQGIIDL